MVPESYHHIIGRYALYDEIASGGMATVHIGRLLGAVGFSRTVAIKRLHPQFAKDPEFVDMFVDEARLAARIRHPNVVPTLDVVKTEHELFLVMEYVQGESLSRLMRRARRRGSPLQVRLVVPVIASILHGLHAAHNAKGERGEALHIVHRDVSPQNALVGTDGVTRVFDFGIAKARGRLQTTREGQIKGKLAYMAPEQLSGGEVGPATDIYAAAVVLWEALANQRLFDADNEAMLLATVLDGAQHPPSHFNERVPAELDAIVMRALNMDPDLRFQSAREFAKSLEKSVNCASSSEIGEWVEELATSTLEKRADRIAEIESQSEVKAFAPGIAPDSRSSFASLSEIGSTAEEPTSQVNSQLSSISVAGVPRQEKSGRSIGWIAALVALLIGGTSAVFLLRTTDPVQEPIPGPAGSTGEPGQPARGEGSTDSQPAPEPPTGSSGGSSGADPLPSSEPVPKPAAPKSQPVAPVTPAPVRPAPVRPAPVQPVKPAPVKPAPKVQPPTTQPKCAFKKVFLPDGSFTYKNVCE